VFKVAGKLFALCPVDAGSSQATIGGRRAVTGG
jgi:hypothetical protein